MWGKVCAAINNPDVLLGDARLHVAELLRQAETVLDDKERIQRELDVLVMERQKVITWARKRVITDEDMEYQLTALTLQEMTLKRELGAYGQIVELTALGDWEEAAREYFLDLQAGIESLNLSPKSDEERTEIYEFKRDIIKSLVNRVTIDERRELIVEIRLNLLEMLKQAASVDITSVQQVGTYTRIYNSVPPRGG